MSADPESEYFCDGPAEELLNALAKIDGLKFAARTSAFSIKGKDVNVGEIGKALGVSTLLDAPGRSIHDWSRRGVTELLGKNKEP
jgi:adenylate cyclase